LMDLPAVLRHFLIRLQWLVTIYRPDGRAFGNFMGQLGGLWKGETL
jgi:hypothetical protein